MGMGSGNDEITLFLCGDVMTARGVDQILAHPGSSVLHEPYVRDAKAYLRLAEERSGPVTAPVDDAYVWGDVLAELERAKPDLRLVNLETAVTSRGNPWPKGIHYRMHPANIGCLRAARIDGCALANNHVLDWGNAGLLETLDSLAKAGIRTAGAGRTRDAAEAPAVFTVPGKGRVLFFSFGLPDAGIPPEWAAGPNEPGVARLPDLGPASIERVAALLRRYRGATDLVVVSLHWGDNWGHEVSAAERAFAHALIDEGGADVIHGHSTHHPRGLEIHENKPILYGCGDFLNDYEGIEGHEEFRAELGLMYFVTISLGDRWLRRLELVPTHIRKLQVTRASKLDAHWMKEVLRRECGKLGALIELDEDHRIHARAA